MALSLDSADWVALNRLGDTQYLNILALSLDCLSGARPKAVQLSDRVGQTVITSELISDSKIVTREPTQLTRIKEQCYLRESNSFLSTALCYRTTAESRRVYMYPYRKPSLSIISLSSKDALNTHVLKCDL